MPEDEGQSFRSLTARIGESDFAAVKRAVERFHATLNDAFLAAYARIIARKRGEPISVVTLPCPADLRRFASDSFPIAADDALTLANMTGMYTLVVEVANGDSFDRTLSLVHDEMRLQKERHRCFAGVSALHAISPWMPAPLLDWLGHTIYSILPISYTNFGIIDAERFAFEGCAVERCYLTGTYRPAPAFQMAVSTFADTCTLNASAVGSQDHFARCQDILDAVKRELLDWSSKA
ncbi:hypothetical protein [Raoultibacter phocaeensis]|uniref:hypothetical protein n=1 Tax=Raoultibacter phocaeensis TaxID=2479841 RepID=UPI0011197F4C|nr:hypothetical protein [Raoultibacter phocaeensis]